MTKNRNTSARPVILSIENLSKTYGNGFVALKNVNLDIHEGEIFALLGPNGAGKTTLISIVCGIVNLTQGDVSVTGISIRDNYKRARSKIGIVPQELMVHEFETIWDTVKLSRGLYGKKMDRDYLESLLKSLSLYDKKDKKVMTLSGGMKRRVLIAKALAHQPSVLFLDEPTAGVDVELRKDMWKIVAGLRDNGVTIILTTHYIEEAEEMADRIGIMTNGELKLVEEKKTLIQKLGKKELILDLVKPLKTMPTSLKKYSLSKSNDNKQLIFQYDTHKAHKGVRQLFDDLKKSGIDYKDFRTRQSSLEEIFVELIQEGK